MEGHLRIKTAIASVAFGAMALCAGGAYAGSLTQPGETSGIALGAPLPEGLYFVNTGSIGGFRGVDDSASNLTVDIPVLAWSTPWTFFGGRIEAYTAAPAVAFGLPGNKDYQAMYNPALLVGEAWNLGNGWGFSNFVGFYAPVDNVLGQNFWTFNERAAISYTGNNWNLTAHMIYGATGDDQNGGGKVHPDYVNVDLTAVKTLGKWQVGAVGFYSTDVSGTDNPNYQKQSQFALGGLVGYNFTGITTQLYVTKDVFSDNYFNQDGSKSYETRLWTRVVVPLWSPEKHEESYK